MKRRIPFIAIAAVAAILAMPADAASRRSREKVEPPPPPSQFKVDGPTRTMELTRVVINVAGDTTIGSFTLGCAIPQDRIFLHPKDAFEGLRNQDYINVFAAEAAAAGYALPGNLQGNLFEEHDAKNSQLLVGAAINELSANGCFTDFLGIRKGEVTSKITIDWQVFDPLEKRLLFRTSNIGEVKFTRNDHSTTVLVEGTREAFRNAVKSILSHPEFVAALKDPRGGAPSNGNMLFPEASAPTAPTAITTQLTRIPLNTKPFVEQIDALRSQVVVVQTPGGHGSGFYIADGLVMTNHHVIEGYRDVKIKMEGGREVMGEVITSDARRDIAIVKAPGGGSGLALQTETPGVGSQVFVIGSPMDQKLAGTVTSGIVSALRNDEQQGPVIQSDVAVIGGNSGGPMFDNKGNVIAVVSFGRVEKGIPVGLNFFIPIADALKVLKLEMTPVLEAKTQP